MIFAGSFIIGLCGFDFVFEVADGNSYTISGDFDDPSLFAAVPAYAFILRAAFIFD